MKTKLPISHSSIHSALCWLALLATFNLPLDNCRAAVTFTNTPVAVSNTYDGVITLQIGGLTNTETVVVQEFLDLNTNGLIDPGDLLVQQFKLTDGQPGMVIGGVTNFNVPGDLNAATGAITATLNFQNGNFMPCVPGKFLFKLSSPVGHFTPLTNGFAVTNFPYAQRFTGNVVSNGASAVVSNAVVLLFAASSSDKGGPNGGPVAGAVANDAGSYSIPAPPGTYMLMAFQSNYLANFGAPPTVALGSGATVTTNISVSKATASVSGKVVDAVNSNIGLPGVMIPVQNSAGLLGVGFTDTNGNFSVGVQSGQWTIKADDTSLIVHGYLGLDNKTNVTAGQTGVTIAVPKATALIYGSVTDNLGNPFPALDVYANDTVSNLYETDAYTAANGNYVMGVLGLGTNDGWWMEANGNNQITNYVFSQETINGNVSTNTAVLQNFTALLAANHITGNVSFNGTNVAGVNVYAWTNLNGVQYNPEVDTDKNGNYWLSVPNGAWTVNVNCSSGGSDCLDSILGPGNYACPNGQIAGINNNNATVNFIIQPCTGIIVLTTNLPNGQVGVYYNQTLEASDCNGTYNWSLNDPADFPGSLNFNANGQIYGTPTNSGTFDFTVQVNDGDGHSTNQNLSLYIAPAVSALLPSQNVFVAPQDGNIYDFLTNGSQSVYASGFSGDEEGLAFDRFGNLYVSDAGNNCIYKITTTGGQSTFASGLNTPRGLVFDSAGNLYQSDAGSGNIYKYTPSGVQSTFASGLGWPMSLAFDPAGNLYEADWDSGNLYKFATNGAQTTFASGLNEPWGLAFDSAGNLYESDFGTGNIYKFATNGVQSTYASGMDEPEGMGFDSAGNLYVANQGNGNVYQIAPGGTPVVFASGLDNPAALVVQAPPTLTADVALYYVDLSEAWLQQGANNLVPNNNAGPFTAYLGLVQSAPGLVPLASVELPTGAFEGLPWGSSAIDLQTQESYSSQAAFNATYPPGDYEFAIYGLDNGLVYPVLDMPAPVYPTPPQVSNFAAAQSLKPLYPFLLQWTDPPDATTNDLIWVFILGTNGAPVFSTPFPATNLTACLNGAATSVLVPTNTFQPGQAYTGVITFFRTTSVNTAAYPGAMGVTLVSDETWFPLTLASGAPLVSQPTRLSGTQFGFLLTGAQDQNYTVLTTTNLALPLSSWTTVLVTNLAGNTALIQDNQATSKQRFYRVLVGP
ncbi:MAG: hypothetical protein ABSE16_11570 [Verrucomicrobiota bacterium]|jgi:sugar lactone lactonase YvrE